MKQNLVKLIIHITRYGYFNNILVLKHIKFDEKINFNQKEIEIINNLLNILNTY